MNGVQANLERLSSSLQVCSSGKNLQDLLALVREAFVPEGLGTRKNHPKSAEGPVQRLRKTPSNRLKWEICLKMLLLLLKFQPNSSFFCEHVAEHKDFALSFPW
mmetsp:Transcript_4956/g.5810  ORF Transcript_4956/g.5810 Transcript_4956/m.5810 type:complete len:104 (-) Transcript_4956:653-964(-)